ncbi:MAG: ATP-binding cassette domain-containing protein [Candidatus Brocadiia bacterium]
MTARRENGPVLRCRGVKKAFRQGRGETLQALDGVSLEIGRGKLAVLVGPDGAGKTTLIRLIAGLMAADEGELTVLGANVATDPQQVQNRLAYMPQRFGLYEDLSVQENLDLYADLHGVTPSERKERYPRLLEMTALGPFCDRLAGRLSGGMKQKLGLACTLIRRPEFLLLDEPTVGVDPLSRRELGRIIHQLVSEQGITVFLSTSSLNEAERCDQAIVLCHGKVLADGAPAEVSALAKDRVFLVEPQAGQAARGLQARLLGEAAVLDAVPQSGRVRMLQAEGASISAVGALSGARVAPTPPRFEDGFMVLLRRASERPHTPVSLPAESPPGNPEGEIVVEVHDLSRRFGDFTAVDHISFDVRRGEVFGLLGPNGAGKTTTFRMLCGLLEASGGTLRVAGQDLRHARASARQRIGYVAQKFSLYGQLSVAENLNFFAGAYGLRGGRKSERIQWAMDAFGLRPFAALPSGQLPGGYKHRLAMAAALMHEPDTLFLDEPTSGADPLVRREFWRRITGLAEHGVTVIVTTHFMEEAEYCDRIVIMDTGRVLAHGAPGDIRRHAHPEPGGEATMEEAFVDIVEQGRRSD